MEDRPIHELLLKQFIRIIDSNKPARKLTKGSHSRAEFKCIDCGRIFISVIKDLNSNLYKSKTKKSTGCSYCAGKKMSPELSFGYKFPNLSQFWNYERNNGITPFDVLPGSDKKYWFKCENGHDFDAQLFNITKKKTPRWCPKCKLKGTSRLEIRLYSELSSIFGESNVIWQKKNNYSKLKFGVECDLLVKMSSRKFIAIELDGFHHKTLQGKERDLRKNQTLQVQGVKLFRIRNNNLDRLSHTDVFFSDNENDVEIVSRLLLNFKNHLSLKKSIQEKIEWYVSNMGLVAEEKFREYHQKLLSQTDLKGGVLKDRPELENHWHPTKNLPYILGNFSRGSRFEAHWICDTCEDEEVLTIKDKYNKTYLCAKCFENVRQVVELKDSLSSKFPSLLDLWDYEENIKRGLEPNKLNPWSEKEAVWKCKIGHKYVSLIKAVSYSYASGNSGCPDCKYNRVIPDLDGKYVSVSELSKKIKKENKGSGFHLTLALNLLSRGATVLDLYAYARLNRSEKLVLNLPKHSYPSLYLDRFLKSLIILILSEKICPIFEVFHKMIEKFRGNISLAERQLGLRKCFIHDYFRKIRKM